MKREPLFNVPSVIVAALAVMALIHAVRTMLLTDQQDLIVLYTFGFVPSRYDASLLPGGTLPGGFGAEIWSFVTYSLLHGSWMHYGVNAVWLLPFGSAVARRFGTLRFLAFFAVTAAAGAALHLATHVGDDSPMIGASAAISGTMAAAMRFAFQHGGPLGLWRDNEDDAYRVPALPLIRVLSDFRVLVFLVVWFGLNIVVGLGTLPLAGSGQVVAWQAHIGGFLAGLVLFSWFDPPMTAPRPDDFGALPHG